MRHVEVRAFLPDTEPAPVFDRLIEFERYPDLVEVVKSVEILDRPATGPMVSSWQVYFRSGVLAWTESDWLNRDDWSIEFHQDEGDFDVFDGVWRLLPGPDGVEVVFAADFDFGVPSLAGIIDPVAARVLAETIQLVLRGLFVDVRFPAGDLVASTGWAR